MYRRIANLVIRRGGSIARVTRLNFRLILVSESHGSNCDSALWPSPKHGVSRVTLARHLSFPNRPFHPSSLLPVLLMLVPLPTMLYMLYQPQAIRGDLPLTILLILLYRACSTETVSRFICSNNTTCSSHTLTGRLLTNGHLTPRKPISDRLQSTLARYQDPAQASDLTLTSLLKCRTMAGKIFDDLSLRHCHSLILSYMRNVGHCYPLVLSI